MGNTLITYKQTLNIKGGLIVNADELTRIYKALEQAIKSISEYKIGDSIYSSIQGETSAGDISGKDFDDFLNEIVSRQLELRSIRVYLSYSTSSNESPYSYTIDMYLGRLYGDLVNLNGSDEKWVLESKDKLEFIFSKISGFPKSKKPILIRAINSIFNGKLVVTAWVAVVFSLLFSRFFPNVYFAWAGTFLTAYALIGVAVQALIDQGEVTPATKFVFVDKEKINTKKSVFDYTAKQPLVIQIIFFIFALVGFISAIFQIIDIAKRYHWI